MGGQRREVGGGARTRTNGEGGWNGRRGGGAGGEEGSGRRTLCQDGGGALVGWEGPGCTVFDARAVAAGRAAKVGAASRGVLPAVFSSRREVTDWVGARAMTGRHQPRRGARRRPPPSGPARREWPRHPPPPLPGAAAATAAAVGQWRALVPTAAAAPHFPCGARGTFGRRDVADMYRCRRHASRPLSPLPPPHPLCIRFRPTQPFHTVHPSTHPPSCPIGPPPHHPRPRCAPWCRHCRPHGLTATRGPPPTGSGGGGGAPRAPPEPGKAKAGASAARRGGCGAGRRLCGGRRPVPWGGAALTK